MFSLMYLINISIMYLFCFSISRLFDIISFELLDYVIKNGDERINYLISKLL